MNNARAFFPILSSPRLNNFLGMRQLLNLSVVSIPFHMPICMWKEPFHERMTDGRAIDRALSINIPRTVRSEALSSRVSGDDNPRTGIFKLWHR